jgi:hypothetical protein
LGFSSASAPFGVVSHRTFKKQNKQEHAAELHDSTRAVVPSHFKNEKRKRSCLLFFLWSHFPPFDYAYYFVLVPDS